MPAAPAGNEKPAEAPAPAGPPALAQSPDGVMADLADVGQVVKAFLAGAAADTEAGAGTAAPDEERGPA
jgi:hypothetical protein